MGCPTTRPRSQKMRLVQEKTDLRDDCGWRSAYSGEGDRSLKPQMRSLRQNKTSSPDSGGTVACEPSTRAKIISVAGAVDAMVICGGRKRGGSHAWIVGRRSIGSRAINACSSAP